MDYTEFQHILRARGQELYRDMPWRRDTRPYYVLVSELMLQQTQVARVIPKFESFIACFPDIASLAQASLSDVLKEWSGLGYNRRAKFLHEAARQVTERHGGILPHDYQRLQSLPGIGPGTAGAIMVYAYNEPIVFIETNIRTVYFHYFFREVEKVSDKQLVPFIEATIDSKNPRGFYWALMDYGSWLKQNVQRTTNQSSHYKKQSEFKGSVREVRGQIVRLLSQGELSIKELQGGAANDERLMPALQGLMKDGLVTRVGSTFHLTK